MKEINVLSLCDGMSCGHIALDKEGISVKNYFAAEIKEIGIKVTKYNYPQTIHIGDVTKIHYESGVLYKQCERNEIKNEDGSETVEWTLGEKVCEGEIDAVIFGSPCQTFSVAMKSELRVGLENKEKSGLFIECYRILKEVNPRYFLMENVARMKNEDMQFISELMGVAPIRINSKLVSAQLRDRYYWTNIPGVEKPQDKGITLQSILTSGFTDREKARALLVSDSRPLTTKDRMIHRYRSTGFTTLIWEEEGNDQSVRYMNQTELERCQTVPEGYTKCLSRNEAADVLGDGWTVDVIAHIFSYMKKDLKESEYKQMEMKISDYQLPEKISFNFEELKQELTAKVSMYETMVYTDENIKDAKADRANLNKLKKALNDERIRREKEYMIPFNTFKSQVNEIIAIIDKPCMVIDQQVKAFEDKQKQDKLDAITEYFNSTEHPEWLHFSQIVSEKWLNASVSMKSVQEEICSKLEQIANDLATLSNLPEFGFEATKVYESSLDINKALNEGHRMSQIAKAKAEREAEQARLKAEAEAKAAEPQPQPTPVVEGFMNPPANEQPKKWVKFQAFLTVDQARELKQFFNDRKIEFKAV